jgi:hypothetical protein
MFGKANRAQNEDEDLERIMKLSKFTFEEENRNRFVSEINGASSSSSAVEDVKKQTDNEMKMLDFIDKEEVDPPFEQEIDPSPSKSNDNEPERVLPNILRNNTLSVIIQDFTKDMVYRHRASGKKNTCLICSYLLSFYAPIKVLKSMAEQGNFSWEVRLALAKQMILPSRIDPTKSNFEAYLYNYDLQECGITIEKTDLLYNQEGFVSLFEEGHFLGPEVFNFLVQVLNGPNILVVQTTTHGKVYRYTGTEVPGRDYCIINLTNKCHFELLLVEVDGVLRSVFSPEDPIIKRLLNRKGFGHDKEREENDLEEVYKEASSSVRELRKRHGRT